MQTKIQGNIAAHFVPFTDQLEGDFYERNDIFVNRELRTIKCSREYSIPDAADEYTSIFAITRVSVLRIF